VVKLNADEVAAFTTRVQKGTLQAERKVPDDRVARFLHKEVDDFRVRTRGACLHALVYPLGPSRFSCGQMGTPDKPPSVPLLSFCPSRGAAPRAHPERALHPRHGAASLAEGWPTIFFSLFPHPPIPIRSLPTSLVRLLGVAGFPCAQLFTYLEKPYQPGITLSQLMALNITKCPRVVPWWGHPHDAVDCLALHSSSSTLILPSPRQSVGP